ncbi:hypothetical protein BRD13_01905 [Halobacteriales archaeon SW_5_70_135]|nr:MAG: hypothetical protein BRD13_01905 [Halobacteriales archaeon SW_5_70_135]
MELPVGDGDVGARTAAVAGVVVLAAVVGAVIVLSDGEDTRPVETVPPADAVAVVEGDLVTHPTTRRLANATLARAGAEPRYDSLLATVEDDLGLRAARIEWLAAFARYPNETRVGTDVGEGYAGVVVRADWRERTLVSSVQDSDIELEERRHEGRAVYRLDRPGPVDVYVAVLAANTYAVSTRERVVEDAIDAGQGANVGLADGLRSALSDRREAAVVRVAARVPQARVDEIDGAGRVPDVDRVAVGYSVHNDTHVGVRATLYAADEAAAADLADLASAVRVLAGSQVGNETVAAALREVTVERSEAAVTLSYRDDVGGVVALGDGVAAVTGDAVEGVSPLRLRRPDTARPPDRRGEVAAPSATTGR